MKTCPFCAESIQDEAIKCKHCGEWLQSMGGQAETAASQQSQRGQKPEPPASAFPGAKADQPSRPRWPDRPLSKLARLKRCGNAIFWAGALFVMGFGLGGVPFLSGAQLDKALGEGLTWGFLAFLGLGSRLWNRRKHSKQVSRMVDERKEAPSAGPSLRRRTVIAGLLVFAAGITTGGIKGWTYSRAHTYHDALADWKERWPPGTAMSILLPADLKPINYELPEEARSGIRQSEFYSLELGDLVVSLSHVGLTPDWEPDLIAAAKNSMKSLQSKLPSGLSGQFSYELTDEQGHPVAEGGRQDLRKLLLSGSIGSGDEGRHMKARLDSRAQDEWMVLVLYNSPESKAAADRILASVKY